MNVINKKKNIEFIKASAGSGKTFTLTDRIIRFLDEKDKEDKKKYTLSEMMLTTFTREAAADFKRKTREKLLENGKTEEAKELELATIGTIDSIAVKFLHRYWYKLGLGADFTELDDKAKAEYIKKSLTETVSEDDITFFNEFYRKLDINKSFEENSKDSNSKDDIWQNDLKGFIEKIQCYNLDENKIEKSQEFTIQLIDKIFPYTLNQEEIHDLTQTFLEYIEGYAAYYKINKPQHDHLKKCQTLKKSLSDNNVSVTDARLLEIVICNAQKKPLENNEELTARGKDAYKSYICSNIIKDDIVKYINRIFDLGKKWNQSFIKYKKENNLVDFSDMERLFIDLLKDKDVQEELREEIKVVMVDEFQDSNAVQIEIYNLLADIAEKNIWVGDPKQAIYRFRGTDTKSTQQLADLYAKGGEQNLNMTWRSVAPLVKFSNEIFSRSFSNHMEQKDIILKYNEAEDHPELHDKNEPINNNVFLWDVRPKKNGNTIEISSAKKLACRISEILANGEHNEQLGKDIKPSDIMILCRNNSEISNLVTAFKEFGLPVSSSTPDISDYLEVQLLLSILRLFVKGSDTKAKVEILHLLHDVRIEDLLNSLINKHGDCQWTEYAECLEKLTNLKEELEGLSVPEMITGIITRLDLLRRVAKWDDGATRRENLIAVTSRAESYDSLCLTKGKGATLEGFLNFLDENVQLPGTPMSTDSIKIMTYHGCKGLESRIVILNELEKDELADNTLARNFLFGTEKYLSDAQNQENLIHFCPRFLKAPNSKFAEKQLELIKNIAEFQAYRKETRNDINKLLYVGVTRAKEKLVLLQKNDNDKDSFAWFKNIDPRTYGENYEGVDNQDDILTLLNQCIDKATEANYSDPVSSGKSSEFRVRKLEKRRENKEKVLKYISPSEADEKDVNLKLLGKPVIIESSGNRITLNANKVKMDVIGTCIHNIFAVWDPEGNKNDELQKVQNIIDGNSLSTAIPHAEEVIRAAEYIHNFLSRTYGKGKMLRELPFRIRKEDRVFSGEMDLIWETQNGCILLDYKNFPGNEKEFMDDSNENHYVGKYKPQLCLYKDALEKAGKTVKATYIYYSIIGSLVKFQ